MSAPRAARPAARETTNAVVGTVAATTATTATTAAAACRRHRQQFGTQRGDQCAGQYRQGQRVVRRGGQHQPGDDGAAGRLHPLRAGQHAAGGQPPGAVRRHHDFVQSGARQVAQRCDAGDRAGRCGRSACRRASTAASRAPRSTFQALARQRADPDPRRACRRLHRAGHPVRKLRSIPITILSTLPSAGVGAVLALLLFNTEFSIIALIGVILLIGIVKKNAIMMIDFALEAERDAQPDAARRDLRGLPAALPPDHDDHLRRHAGRAAAGAQLRRRRRDAPAAGHRHRRRADAEPDADAVHDAGAVPVPRSIPSRDATPLAAGFPRHRRHAGAAE